MFKNIRRRFILFNMIVISCVLVILTLLVLFKNKNNLSSKQIIIFITLSSLLVYIGSLIISKFALRPIQSSWQRQLDFTADASHELRTPLAVIRTNLEIIIDNKDETIESQMKWIENIELENIRMTKLVDDLLTLSRADTNQQNLDIEAFMLGETLEEIKMSFEAVALEKEISFKAHMKDEIVFTGDRNRIKQLIIIILDNAIKYTKTYGSVFIEIKRQDDMAKIIIKDTGVGISENDINKIFNRFYRVTSARKQNEDGIGLGLSIAKWIVDEHSGVIKVESVPEKGTSFIIMLPVEKTKG